MKAPRHILPIIVFAQFCCTSLWFAGNGVMGDLIREFSFAESALGHLTTAVQFGFISGTLFFAFFTISDRFPPARVFFFSALFGAIFNLGLIWEGNSLSSILGLRFLTGFFLAGIYPVGMKIAADYYEKGLGLSLGFLVGALSLGTAFPHLAKEITQAYPWQAVLILTSSLALLGGLLMLFFVPNGPYRVASKALDMTAFMSVFRNREFRAASYGYFGHMWELYAFWAFVPLIIKTYYSQQGIAFDNISIWSFSIIAFGGLACILGGYLSKRFGAKPVARTALFISGICCILSPLMFGLAIPALFLTFLLVWGFTVIMDSPLFSSLVANNADASIKGTALTIVNCIGFAITIISIQSLNVLNGQINPRYLFLILAFGPILGLLGLRTNSKINEQQ